MICQTWTIGKAIRALFADRVTYVYCMTECQSSMKGVCFVLHDQSVHVWFDILLHKCMEKESMCSV